VSVAGAVQKTSLERDLAARIDGEVRVDLGSRSTCEEPNSRVVGQRVPDQLAHAFQVV
jgi:hypothetical protein